MELKSLRRLCIMRVLASLAALFVGMMVICAMEGWSYIDGFYWATVTLVTVGFGDYQPSSASSKWFTIFYSLIGCTFLTLALSEFGTYTLDMRIFVATIDIRSSKVCSSLCVLLVRYPIVARVLKNEIKVMSQFSGKLSSEKLNQIFNNDLFDRMPDLKR